MIAQLERQDKLINQLSLPQRDDCTTIKKRIVKQPVLFFPSRMIAKLERQEMSSNQLSLRQLGDCITRKTRQANQPTLSSTAQ